MDSRKLNMVITLAQWFVLCAVCMCAMLYVALNKTIVISGEVRDQMNLSSGSGQGFASGVRKPLLFGGQEGTEGVIRIPLEKDIKAENVMVENRYMDGELWVYIERAEGRFYSENAVTGDLSSVESGFCEVQSDGVILKIKMDHVWEYYSTMEYGSVMSASGAGNSMVITFKEPHEVYRLAVVIDPMGGGSETGAMGGGYAEKTLALRVAGLLSGRLGQSDIKLYFTRQEDAALSREERLGLLSAVGADLYIRIGAGADEDPSRYGIQGIYNEAYFIPGFGNVQLADALTKSVTIASSNRAVGLVPAEEDSILREITIPAAQINLGYLTNAQEAELLRQEAYQEKLAQGIADAIREAYKQIGSEER